ncbi:hypothetical protein Dimus_038626 [Dionaea muscipula]
MYAFGTPNMLDGENDQQWNHVPAEDLYLHFAAARSTSSENGFHPRDNVPIDRVNYASGWIPPPRLNGHSSSSHIGASHNHSETSGHCDSLHQLPTGNVLMVTEDHAHHAASSNYVVESNFFDVGLGNARGSYKRKSPGIPHISERGCANGYYTMGSSSDASSSTDSQQERSKVEVQRIPWEPTHVTSTFRSNHLSGEGESSSRNVRSRSSFELEYDTFGTDRSMNHPPPVNLTRHPLDHSILLDYPCQDPTGPYTGWNVPHVRTIVPDASNFSNEMTQFFNGNSVSDVSGLRGGYHHDLITSRHPGVPQSLAASSGQGARGVRSSYVHRSNPTRVSAGSSRVGLATPANEGLHFATDTYPVRHSRRSFGSAGGRIADRSGRPRFSAERYRSLSVVPMGHVRLTPEGLMVVDRSSLYASRNLSDQHRDMRLDIDNMSYEELLALGERIGSVNTGVRDDLLSTCLTEMPYISLAPIKEERCAICLVSSFTSSMFSVILDNGQNEKKECSL